MGKKQAVRELTGLVRRKAKRIVNPYRRSSHLSHSAVGFRRQLQYALAATGQSAHAALNAVPYLLVLAAIFSANGNDGLAVVYSSLLRLHLGLYLYDFSRFGSMFRLDYKLHDIPTEEGALQAANRLARQDICFDSWTAQECYDFTSFTKDQLREIYRHFGLADLAAAEPYIGYIPVPTNHNRNYLFNPEELFLFMMTRCKTGHASKGTCDLIFGGNPSRWSFGYPWILKYLDKRYRRTLSHRKLEDFVDDFPRFYDAISKFMQREATRHFDDGTAEDRTGLNFCPFQIFGFIDCSIDRINRPLSGPDGDYIGAPRKANQDEYQRSVYTAYKKYHGIKVETVHLPNGLSTIYGPVSARVHDVGGVLMSSGLDRFLWRLQRNNQHVYSAFGDGAYNARYLRCTRSYYRSLVPGQELSPAQKLCNKVASTCRQTIEHSYGDIENIFQICVVPKGLRLGKKDPHALQQLRVCHLLSNIYTCLNGNKACSYAKFDCPPPSLEDYLKL